MLHPKKADAFLLALCLLAMTSMWSRFGLFEKLAAKNSGISSPPTRHSDFYPVWVGARAFLLQGRDPYSRGVTQEIQEGYFGAKIDPSVNNPQQDEARFAYPLYTVIMAAPVALLPFEWVHVGLYGLLCIAGIVSALWCIQGMALKMSQTMAAACLLLFLGCWPVTEALKMQQLTLAVAALMAGALAAEKTGRYGLAGVLLALATIKPHLAIWIIGWRLVQGVFRWKEQKYFFLTFFGVVFCLVSGTYLISPGWITRWLETAEAYRNYNPPSSLLPQLLSPSGFQCVLGGAILLVLALTWKTRYTSPGNPAFNVTYAMLTTLTVTLSSIAHSYDEVFLFPAAALIFNRLSVGRLLKAERLVVVVAIVLICTSWVFSVGMWILELVPGIGTAHLRMGMAASMVLIPLGILLALGVLIWRIIVFPDAGSIWTGIVSKEGIS